MPRNPRSSIDSSFLHIMVQGVNKEYIFSTERYIKEYLFLINKYSKEFEINIIAYCIMNNHAHLLVYTEHLDKLAKFMQKVNLKYSHFYNQKEKRVGVLFRNRYKSEAIYNIKYLINCIKYIHMNPVKAEMVKNCEDYPFSSYSDYLYNQGISQSPIVLETLGKDFSVIISNNSTDYLFIDNDKHNSYDVSKYMNIRYLSFSKH